MAEKITTKEWVVRLDALIPLLEQPGVHVHREGGSLYLRISTANVQYKAVVTLDFDDSDPHLVDMYPQYLIAEGDLKGNRVRASAGVEHVTRLLDALQLAEEKLGDVRVGLSERP